MTIYKYSSEWIHKLEDEVHWRFYWHQQKLMTGRISSHDRIAEIGVGSGFTYNYLKSRGYNIVSIDIDQEKKPDVVANIVECKPDILHYDAILAFNIFEHLPFNAFLAVVMKCGQAGVSKLFMSLPSNRKILAEFGFTVGRRWQWQKIITGKRKAITTPHHHWELDYGAYTPQKVQDELGEREYVCREFFRFRRQAYFYFEKGTLTK